MKNGCNSWDGEGEELCQSHFKEEEKRMPGESYQ